jgi:hypothetical protein
VDKVVEKFADFLPEAHGACPPTNWRFFEQKSFFFIFNNLEKFGAKSRQSGKLPPGYTVSSYSLCTTMVQEKLPRVLPVLLANLSSSA